MGNKQRESAAWSNFDGSIDKGRLLTHRVENMEGNGTPDVIMKNNYGTVIWCENKALEVWPKRPTTCPLKHSFERGQLGWMREWKFKNGHAFCLLRVEDKEFYLLDPAWRIEEKTRAELLSLATATGKTQIIEFLYELRNKGL